MPITATVIMEAMTIVVGKWSNVEVVSSEGVDVGEGDCVGDGFSKGEITG